MVALKVCGITNLEDARQIAKLNCRMLGLIFADASPRCIDRSTAQKISLLVKSLDSDIKLVGVFKDQPITFVSETASRLNLDYVQLHGEEDTDYIEKLNSPTIKVIEYGAQKSTDKEELASYGKLVDYFLLDKPKNKNCLQGDPLIQSLKNRLDQIRDLGPGIIIAGGINQSNVRIVIDQFKPDLVDIASSVESAPGQKDLNKVKAFIETMNQSRESLTLAGKEES